MLFRSLVELDEDENLGASHIDAAAMVCVFLPSDGRPDAYAWYFCLSRRVDLS